MQIILMQKVVNLGNLGDVVKVKEGYARNYLIPQGKAKRVTEASLAEFATKRAELERAAAETLAAAQDKAAKMEGLSVTIARKAGVDGRLFGSVSNADIAEALAAQGFEVAKSDVRMPNGQLKMIGESELTVSLHTDVTADIKVVVVGE
ncbi:MAG: 50S ribosomal protein L9 [Rhodocyclaceae bacterium]|nr:50S ribosomal protein L9 [Rhodocyclaceae bacterium]